MRRGRGNRDRGRQRRWTRRILLEGRGPVMIREGGVAQGVGSCRRDEVRGGRESLGGIRHDRARPGGGVTTHITDNPGRAVP